MLLGWFGPKMILFHSGGLDLRQCDISFGDTDAKSGLSME